MEELYLITGAAGHLGSVITRLLIQEGKNVRALVLPKEEHIPEKAEIYYGNVVDKESLKPFFHKLQGKEVYVIHCAGIVSIASKYNEKVFQVNVDGTKNVVDLCREHSVKKLVYVSSVHAIPEGEEGVTIKETTSFSPDQVVGLYAKTKAEATAYVLQEAQKGLNVSVVHPSGIVGPYDYGKGHITALILEYCKGRLFSGMKGGYDFVDVRDVADGVLRALRWGKSCECYILSNQFYHVSELLEMLHEITGKRRVWLNLPLWFVKGTAGLSELYYKLRKQPPLFTSYSIYTLGTYAVFSHEKADAELGYTVRDMKDTLKDTVAWLKEIKKI